MSRMLFYFLILRLARITNTRMAAGRFWDEEKSQGVYRENAAIISRLKL